MERARLGDREIGGRGCGKEHGGESEEEEPCCKIER